MTANIPTKRRESVAWWLVLLLLLAVAAVIVAFDITKTGTSQAVEDQFDWLVRNAWFPLQLFLLWLVHARLLQKDKEELF